MEKPDASIELDSLASSLDILSLGSDSKLNNSDENHLKSLDETKDTDLKTRGPIGGVPVDVGIYSQTSYTPVQSARKYVRPNKSSFESKNPPTPDPDAMVEFCKEFVKIQDQTPLFSFEPSFRSRSPIEFPGMFSGNYTGMNNVYTAVTNGVHPLEISNGNYPQNGHGARNTSLPELDPEAVEEQLQIPDLTNEFSCNSSVKQAAQLKQGGPSYKMSNVQAAVNGVEGLNNLPHQMKQSYGYYEETAQFVPIPKPDSQTPPLPPRIPQSKAVFRGSKTMTVPSHLQKASYTHSNNLSSETEQQAKRKSSSSETGFSFQTDKPIFSTSATNRFPEKMVNGTQFAGKMEMGPVSTAITSSISNQHQDVPRCLPSSYQSQVYSSSTAVLKNKRPVPVPVQENLSGPLNTCGPGGINNGSTAGINTGNPCGRSNVSPTGMSIGSPAGMSIGSPAGMNMGSPAGMNVGSPGGMNIGSPAGINNVGRNNVSPTGMNNGTHIGRSHVSPAGMNMGSPAGINVGSPSRMNNGSPAGIDSVNHGGRNNGNYAEMNNTNFPGMKNSNLPGMNVGSYIGPNNGTFPGMNSGNFPTMNGGGYIPEMNNGYPVGMNNGQHAGMSNSNYPGMNDGNLGMNDRNLGMNSYTGMMNGDMNGMNSQMPYGQTFENDLQINGVGPSVPSYPTSNNDMNYMQRPGCMPGSDNVNNYRQQQVVSPLEGGSSPQHYPTSSPQHYPNFRDYSGNSCIPNSYVSSGNVVRTSPHTVSPNYDNTYLPLTQNNGQYPQPSPGNGFNGNTGLQNVPRSLPDNHTDICVNTFNNISLQTGSSTGAGQQAWSSPAPDWMTQAEKPDSKLNIGGNMNGVRPNQPMVDNPIHPQTFQTKQQYLTSAQFTAITNSISGANGGKPLSMVITQPNGHFPNVVQFPLVVIQPPGIGSDVKKQRHILPKPSPSVYPGQVPLDSASLAVGCRPGDDLKTPGKPIRKAKRATGKQY